MQIKVLMNLDGAKDAKMIPKTKPYALQRYIGYMNIMGA
jgi:hypothetical protein